MAEITEPVVTEITVSYSGGVKVAIEDYGKKSGDSTVFLARKYAIPPTWEEDQVKIFEMEKILEIREELDPILQEEHDNFMAQRRFK